jgi:hypothetical protein
MPASASIVVTAMAMPNSDDPGDDDQRRDRRRLHRHRQALDDVGRVAGDRGLGDAVDRAELGAGVVFGHPHQEAGDDQADDAAIVQVPALERDAADAVGLGHPDHQVGDRDQGHERQHRRGDETLVEGAHDALLGTEPHEEGTDDRGDDAHAADGQRIDHHPTHRLLPGEEDRGQHHGRHHRDRVGLEQVGGHAGAVAHIVADIVGDDRGIARVVLGNAGLDLADQVGAHVGALGKDAAAETGEDRDQRRAEAQGHQRVDQVAPGRPGAQKNAEVDRDRQQRQAGHQHAGHRAGAEREAEPFRQPPPRGLGGAHVGPHRHVHADIAGRTRQNGADQVADPDRHAEQQRQHHEDDDADHRDGAILPVQIGLGAFLNGAGDLLHTLAAGIRGQHGPRGPDAVQTGQQAARDGKQHGRNHRGFPIKISQETDSPGAPCGRGSAADAVQVRAGGGKMPEAAAVRNRTKRGHGGRCSASCDHAAAGARRCFSHRPAITVNKIGGRIPRLTACQPNTVCSAPDDKEASAAVPNTRKSLAAWHFAFSADV